MHPSRLNLFSFQAVAINPHRASTQIDSSKLQRRRAQIPDRAGVGAGTIPSASRIVGHEKMERAARPARQPGFMQRGRRTGSNLAGDQRGVEAATLPVFGKPMTDCPLATLMQAPRRSFRT
ncbi:hypothetical protein [Bradyrhizobium sp. CCGB20]|uniref:hypothetical protein n=1 Tax=Bradyrhizobium sp. CCGB20 TaxID=2949633 RepID=UPI0020B4532B|nr:hypothetical protein [Bradyrhizobium sp. CCGB20]MCP3397404.1 hypothetical protein [Bradyrhizobium sp. CCGB20]